MDLLTFFVRPPGDLLYFVIVMMLSLVALLMSWQRRVALNINDNAPDVRRLSTAMLGIVVIWSMVLGGLLIAALLLIEVRLVLPPLERAVSLLIVVILVWALISSTPPRWGNIPSTLLALGMITANIIYIYTAVRWSSIAFTESFNASMFESVYMTALLVLSLFASLLALIFIRSVIDAPLKAVCFLVIAVGSGLTLFASSPATLAGDYPPLFRISMIAALLLNVIIVQRANRRLPVTASSAAIREVAYSFPVAAARPVTDPHLPSASASASNGHVSDNVSPLDSASTSISPQPSGAVPVNSPQYTQGSNGGSMPIERESVQLLRVLGLILEDSTPNAIPLQIVKVTLDVLRAEVGAIMKINDGNYADVIAVYDRSMRRTNEAISVNFDLQPNLVEAIDNRTQLELRPGDHADELSDIYARLGVSQIGPLYYQPMIHEHTLMGVLLIALPYSQRSLTLQEQEILKGVALISAGLLSLSFKADDSVRLAEEHAIQGVVERASTGTLGAKLPNEQRTILQENLQEARDQIAELSQQVSDLKAQLEYQRNRVASALGDTEDGLSFSQQIIAISTDQEKLRSERDELADRLQEAEAALVDAIASDDNAAISSVVDSLRRERDDLMAERERLQAQLDDLQGSEGALLPEALQEVVERMSDEKARLQYERDQLSARLDDLQIQMGQLGIDANASSLSFLIGKLYEDRSLLRTKNEALTSERNLLLRERQQLEERIAQEKEREKLIKTLQEQIKNLAADRDAAIIQRDQMRQETYELGAKLDSVRQHRARLMAQQAEHQEELNERNEQQAKLQRQIQRLSDHVSELMDMRDQLTADLQIANAERERLLASLEGDSSRAQTASTQGTDALRASLADLTAQRGKLERALNEAQAEIAELRDQLAQPRISVSVSDERQDASSFSPENGEVVMSLVQELRTPMTSISGYVELLLAESAGILGEMQRQFLQRVASNVNRLTFMLEDLIRLTALDTGQFTLSAVPVDVVSAIEEVITNTSTQFRAKGLSVNLELDPAMPRLHADRDSFNQILGQLLTNAYVVSPPDTEITVRAGQGEIQLPAYANELSNSLIVSITDRGGGILPEDRERVFARKYKATNPLIQGLGDTGVGMAVAKALVEAHGGVMWMESTPNRGTTFHFALPFNGIQVASKAVS
jgi:signal transduction histidine kinase